MRRTLDLSGSIFGALLCLIAIAITLNRIYLNQAAGGYSDREMLTLLLPCAVFAFFAARLIRKIEDTK